MKNTIKIIGTITILSIIIFLQACTGDTKKVEEKTETLSTTEQTSQMNDSNNYACPMHKNITGKKGDKCSECGMDLVEMTHCCSMHKNIKGMKGDKCSECKMDLAEMTHCCSMHENMKGMKGDKCAECGMDMEEMKGMEHQMHK